MSIYLRAVIFVAIAIASFLLGYCYFSDATAVAIFMWSGYWTVGLTVLLFILFIWRGYRDASQEVYSYVKSRAGKIGFVAVVCGTLFLLRAEPLGYKTVMDDHVLAGTAKQMHETRLVRIATRTMSINGVPTTLRTFVDKRPVLQPFLVATVHDLTGYRPRNGIYLNVFITPFILLLLYLIAERLGGIATGVAAVALLSTLPLLSYMCAGGGLEPLNLFFILATWLLGGLYLAKPDANRMGAFLLSGILLAQCRYESVIFILPVGLTVVWSWLRERRLTIPWQLMLCPILLIPYLWNHRVFSASETFWQMYDIVDAAKPFSIDYMYDNFGRAIQFFFDFTHFYPNSWLLIALGITALILLGVKSARHVPLFAQARPMMQATVIFLVGIFALFLLLLAYAWEFNHQIIQRLSLPLHLPLAVLGAYLLFYFIKSKVAHRIAIGLLALYIVAYAYPVTSQRLYSKRYVAAMEFDSAEEFINGRGNEHMVVIADNAVFFDIMGKDSLSTALANIRKNQIRKFLDYPNSPPLYYFRRLVYDAPAKKFVSSSHHELDEAYVYETIWEKNISERRKIAFVRITDIKGVEYEGLPEYESDSAFMQDWAKNLP